MNQRSKSQHDPGRAPVEIFRQKTAATTRAIAHSPEMNVEFVPEAAPAEGNTLRLAQPAANLLLARAVPADRQGLAFGIKQSAIPAAAMLGGLAVPSIALTWGWRWAFAAGGAFALMSAVTVPRTVSASEAPKPGTPPSSRFSETSKTTKCGALVA